MNYWLFIGVDGCGSEEVVSLARKCDFCKTTVMIQNDHVGCNNNTRFTINAAFDYFDYVIHLEDDIPLGIDGLRYFEWAEKFRSDKSIWSVTGWRHPNGWLPGDIPKPELEDGRISLISGFYCWSWATWKDRWVEMVSNWTTGDDHSRSWDIHLNEVRKGRLQVVPRIARATNLGYDLGTHGGGRLLPYWSGCDGFKFDEDYKADWNPEKE